MTEQHQGADAHDNRHDNRRQVLYWRLLARLFDHEEQPSLESASLAVVADIGLPAALLDPQVSIDTVAARYPELAAEFDGLMTPEPDPDGIRDQVAEVRRAALASKVLLNVYGTGAGTVTAGQLARWQSDAGWLERSLGCDPGGLRRGGPGRGPGGGRPGRGRPGSGGRAVVGQRGAGGFGASPDNITGAGPVGISGAGPDGAAGAGSVGIGGMSPAAGGGAGPSATGGGEPGRAGDGGPAGTGGMSPAGPPGMSGGGAIPDFSNLLPGIGAALGEIEDDLVKRMHLREVLADPGLARQLTPSMSLIEQLLRDKDNLSGVALANAKALIRRFVDEVAEVLRTQVEKASAGALDHSVPPKRVFRNLDLDRTIWKNLTNWSPEEQRLYVDRLYYRHTARKSTPRRLIVVVDQSGSMVDSMVNCTILASIFAGLPKVDVHLIAYDTKALDLTPWVHDPFETLLRTSLGGGTDGTVAMAQVQPKITEPRGTVVVWISDFFESQAEQLYASMAAVYRSGAKFIPVGSVTSAGRGSVNPWFRERFKDQGTPVISGHIRKLVHELKTFLG
jgi:hypothetical protein